MSYRHHAAPTFSWSGEQHTPSKNHPADRLSNTDEVAKRRKDGFWERRDEEDVTMKEKSHSSRLLLLFISLALVLGTVWALPEVVRRAPVDEGPRGPWEGVSPDVQYDNYTLILKGQRVFLQYALPPFVH